MPLPGLQSRATCVETKVSARSWFTKQRVGFSWGEEGLTANEQLHCQREGSVGRAILLSKSTSQCMVQKGIILPVYIAVKGKRMGEKRPLKVPVDKKEKHRSAPSRHAASNWRLWHARIHPFCVKFPYCGNSTLRTWLLYMLGGVRYTIGRFERDCILKVIRFG
jgi:hypothetical protein